jgi:ubiquinone biosynthesis O-methyltransferase
LSGFKALHVLNRTRLTFIRAEIERLCGLPLHLPQPFAGLSLLDVGCGGGLLSEPLARLGGQVVGVDATEGNVRTAAVHAARNPTIATRLSYVHHTVEGLVEEGGAYDVVLASEVVEHVVDMRSFVADCAAATKPGGTVLSLVFNLI